MTNEERRAMIEKVYHIWYSSPKSDDIAAFSDAIAAIEPIIRKDEARKCAELASEYEQHSLACAIMAPYT